MLPADSTVVLGEEIDSTKVRDKGDAGKASLSLLKDKDTWWTVNLNGFKYGDKNVQGSFKYAILDTGTSLLGIEKTTFTEIANEVLKIEGADCDPSIGCVLPNACE